MDFWDSWKGNLIGATIQLGRLERVLVTFMAAADITIYLSGFYEKHSSPVGSHKPPSLTPNAPSW